MDRARATGMRGLARARPSASRAGKISASRHRATPTVAPVFRPTREIRPSTVVGIASAISALGAALLLAALWG